jgi:hypothetical protein
LQDVVVSFLLNPKLPSWFCGVLFSATISLTYKEGNKMECSNYWGISVLYAAYTILAQLVSKYLELM